MICYARYDTHLDVFCQHKQPRGGGNGARWANTDKDKYVQNANAPYIHDITIHIYVTIVTQKNKTDVCYTQWRIQDLRLGGAHFLGIRFAPPLERLFCSHYTSLYLDFLGFRIAPPPPCIKVYTWFVF